MRILQSYSRQVQGNTLLVTIVVTGLIGFLLAAYMGLVKSQNVATMRSQSWNAAIPVVEAGIEDALTHINIQLTNDLNVNGWQKQGNIYFTSRWIGSNFYVATIANWVVGVSTNKPVIESRGYVAGPVAMASINEPVLALVPVQPQLLKKYVARGIRCTTKTDALWSRGMSADGIIDIKGNNVVSDSYDSRAPGVYSDALGRYDATKRKDNGSIATNSGLTNSSSLNIGSADIYGKVATGPGGSVTIGPNGCVGSTNYVDNLANQGTIQTGWVTDDMNVEFGEVRPPSGAFASVGAGTYNGLNYTYVLGREPLYRVNGDLNVANSALVVTNHVTLWVTRNISFSGSGKIIIAPGAKLILYGGHTNLAPVTSTTFGGGGVGNLTANALAFQYFGLPSNTTMSLGGNTAFVGAIYAPNAVLSLDGGGSVGDLSGSVVVKSVLVNGNWKFHYDEAMAYLGPPRGYVVTRWDEMKPQEVASGGPSL
jgi:hypothetical protein